MIRRSIKPDSVVYTDGYATYDVLDVSDFKHYRINHSIKFVEGKTNHINGIENPHLRRGRVLEPGQASYAPLQRHSEKSVPPLPARV